MNESEIYTLTNPGKYYNVLEIIQQNPIYIPKRTKLKGYQKENRRSSFNKNR